ncbi:hypothetical protein CYMTET_33732 [Cymbomonas tetramitiformis]|uniref:NB-ARC domain-containing protein n=1 Tax=Cymbomonas tetramitiformis TaxID=36881 RepID=A0AAE0FCQ2_9CHLO|nr:hypothetical protein CYMTET_33732 [Cymbomonas tetramitiformis]
MGCCTSTPTAAAHPIPAAAAAAAAPTPQGAAALQVAAAVAIEVEAAIAVRDPGVQGPLEEDVVDDCPGDLGDIYCDAEEECASQMRLERSRKCDSIAETSSCSSAEDRSILIRVASRMERMNRQLSRLEGSMSRVRGDLSQLKHTLQALRSLTTSLVGGELEVPNKFLLLPAPSPKRAKWLDASAWFNNKLHLVFLDGHTLEAVPLRDGAQSYRISVPKQRLIELLPYMRVVALLIFTARVAVQGSLREREMAAFANDAERLQKGEAMTEEATTRLRKVSGASYRSFETFIKTPQAFEDPSLTKLPMRRVANARGEVEWVAEWNESAWRQVGACPGAREADWLDGRDAGGGAKSAGGRGRGNPGRLARLPRSMPDLPEAYQGRTEMLEPLKALVLARGAASCAGAVTLTGRRRSKMAMHGMGGIGKTMLAVALLHDTDVRAAYDVLVWVSVGQDPNLLQLQQSIHIQLTGAQLPQHASTPQMVMGALDDAAQGREVLLVLDDLWDAGHEKLLNCIDLDTASMVLASSRIQGLLERAKEVEVGLLSKPAALSLLLEVAGMGMPTEGSREYALAEEGLALCGRLPLTVTIAGSMVQQNGSEITPELTQVMAEAHGAMLRVQGSKPLEGVEVEMTLEDRVISSSLQALRRRSMHSAVELFKQLAVFPEDAAVPMCVFEALVPVLCPEELTAAQANVALRRWLTTLLRYHLLQGSVQAEGGGVFMHDIVRSHAIMLHSEEELRGLQVAATQALLAARPAEGFPEPEHAVPGSLGDYVARYLHWHMRGSLAAGEEPWDDWVAHDDLSVQQATAFAVGASALRAMAEAWAQQKQHARAARLMWNASALVTRGHISLAESQDLVFSAVEQLQKAQQDDGQRAAASGGLHEEFEMAVLRRAFISDMGSERHTQAMAYMHEKQRAAAAVGAAAFSSRTDEILLNAVRGMGAMGMYGGERSVWPNPSWEHLEEAVAIWHVNSALAHEAAQLATNEMEQFLGQLISVQDYSLFPFAISCDRRQIENVGGEATIVHLINTYDYHVHGAFLKSIGFGADLFVGGAITLPLALQYGSLAALDTWCAKVHGVLEMLKLPITRQYAAQWFECFGFIYWAIPCLLLCGRRHVAHNLIVAAGLGWHDDENFALFLTQLYKQCPSSSEVYPAEPMRIVARLIAALAAPEGFLDTATVSSWMPPPTALVEIDRCWCFHASLGVSSAAHLAARLFLRLGRHADAVETARLALLQGTKKRVVAVECHRILAQAAAEQSRVEDIEEALRHAKDEARRSQLPLMELLVAHDLNDYYAVRSTASWRGAAESLSEVCGRMGRSMGDFVSIWQNEAR